MILASRGVSSPLVPVVFVFVTLAALSVSPQSFAQGKPDEKEAPATALAPVQLIAAEPDSATEGTVTVAGQSIDYKAVAGTLTVGATDAEDATLGFDGKLLPDSGIKSPANPADSPATARMFYAAYFKKGI